MKYEIEWRYQGDRRWTVLGDRGRRNGPPKKIDRFRTKRLANKARARLLRHHLWLEARIVEAQL